MTWSQIVQRSINFAESKGEEFSPSPRDKTKVRRFAEALGVDRVELREMEGDSLLIERPDGCITIFLNSRQPRLRHRFSLAHELSHLLLEDVLGKEAKHQRRRFAPHQDPEGQRIETLCNMMASSLLMPKVRVTEIVSRCGWNANSVQVIAKNFDVSFEAAARRYVKVNPHPSAMFILGRGRDGHVKPTQTPILSDALEGNAIEMVRPRYGQQESISRAFYGSELVVSSEKVVLSRGRGRRKKTDILSAKVESLGRGFSNNRRVYSFVSLS